MRPGLQLLHWQSKRIGQPLQHLRIHPAAVVFNQVEVGRRNPCPQRNICLPQTLLQPLLATIPYQAFAAEVAAARGYDVDKPRNLAKSVTVE